MRHLSIVIILYLFTSCSWKEYSDEKYVIGKNYRDLISTYKAGDTLTFEDNSNNFSSFLITKIDSFLLNRRGHFINGREEKSISIHSRDISNPADSSAQNDNWLILITKYPDDDTTYFNVRLKDFFTIEDNASFNLYKDTVTANRLQFTSYYRFRPKDYDDLKNPNSVSEIYITKEKGIIAYKYLNGKWWTRFN